MTMPDLASRLVAEEMHRGGADLAPLRAALRVCERLRLPLSTYAGAAGFRSLLSRALSLAKTEEPWLAGLELKADGTLQPSAAAEEQIATEKAARAGAALVAQLLGLLVTFIGEALTLRLVHDVWPKAANRESPAPRKLK